MFLNYNINDSSVPLSPRHHKKWQEVVVETYVNTSEHSVVQYDEDVEHKSQLAN